MNNPKEKPNWHCLSSHTAAKQLRVEPNLGLTNQQAADQLKTIGLNRLLEAASRSPWLLFFGQFKSLLILVLIIGAGLAASIGNIKDAAVISGKEKNLIANLNCWSHQS